MKLDYAKIVEEAHTAGRAAVEKFTPTPMYVGQAKSLFSNEIDTSKPVYYVEDGVCGYAWVRFPGNKSFGRWATKAGIARKSEYRGCYISISDYNQSMQKKEVHARAFANVLKSYGIEAWADSRLD